MAIILKLSSFQTQQNLNRPNDNDAMDPSAPYAIADTVLQGIEAVIRTLSLDPIWITLLGLLGSWAGGLAVTFIDGTHFSIQGDQTFYYPVGNRVRAFVTAGTILGTVTASTFAGGITTVTVVWDSGTLDAGLTDAQPSALHPSQNAIPGNVATQTKNPLFVQIDNGGSGVAYTDTLHPLTPPLTAYPIGPVFAFKFDQTIPGPNPTVNLASLGAVSLVKNGSTSLAPGDILTGQIGLFIYDGSNFQFLGAIQPASVLTVSTGGSGSTYTATPSPAFASYQQNTIYLFKFTQTNPGTPVNVNISGLGNVPVVKDGTVALEQGDIQAAQILALVYDGANFQILGPVTFAAPAGGPGQTNPIINPVATITSGNLATGGTLTALVTSPASLALKAPAGGGPFRLLVEWFCAIDASGASGTARCDFEISDGTNKWAAQTVTIPAGEKGGAGKSGISPGAAYADGATVTITLTAVASHGPTVGGGNSAAGGIPSTISAVFIPCN
jgi:hypothetical protein